MAAKSRIWRHGGKAGGTAAFWRQSGGMAALTLPLAAQLAALGGKVAAHFASGGKAGGTAARRQSGGKVAAKLVAWLPKAANISLAVLTTLKVALLQLPLPPFDRVPPLANCCAEG